MLAFADIEVGKTLGVDRQSVSPDLLDQWESIYPNCKASDGVPPLGLLSVLMMRAYCNVLVDRPAGNIHVGQSFVLTRAPTVGEQLLITVKCAEKLEHKGRLITKFHIHIRSSDHGDEIAGAMATLFWAA